MRNWMPYPVETTFDACILEFDFVPIGSSVSFNYVFGLRRIYGLGLHPNLMMYLVF